MRSMIAAGRRGDRDGRPVATDRGFTLVELMVAIVVLAILLAIGVPSFRDAALSSRLTGYANDLVASSQLARSEAIKRNSAVLLCASKSGTACGIDADTGWEAGWIVLAPARDVEVPTADPDDDPALTEIVTIPAEVLQRQQPLAPEFRISESGDLAQLTYPPTVAGATPATFTVCRASPVGSQERTVTITASGSASVTRTTDGACP